MVVQPRRPTSEEYLEIERYLMEQSFIKYNYTWPEGSEVLLKLLPIFCMLVNFSCFCCRMLTFFKLDFQIHLPESLPKLLYG